MKLVQTDGLTNQHSQAWPQLKLRTVAASYRTYLNFSDFLTSSTCWFLLFLDFFNSKIPWLFTTFWLLWLIRILRLLTFWLLRLFDFLTLRKSCCLRIINYTEYKWFYYQTVNTGWNNRLSTRICNNRPIKPTKLSKLTKNLLFGSFFA